MTWREQRFSVGSSPTEYQFTGHYRIFYIETLNNKPFEEGQYKVEIYLYGNVVETVYFTIGK